MIEVKRLSAKELKKLKQIEVFQTRPDGVFVGYTVADESPNDPGEYLVPGGAVREEPPEFGEGSRARYDWKAQAWIIEPNPEAPEPAPPPEDPDAPADVSIRQFAQALAETGALEWPEARAWSARGEVPAMIAKQVEEIEDETERNRALMFLEAAKSVEYKHPKTQQLAALMEWDDERLRAILKFAATL